MERKTLLLILLAAFILTGISGCIMQSGREDIKACEKDSECVVVDSINGLDEIPSRESCGCVTAAAINSKYAGLWEQKREESRNWKCDIQCKPMSSKESYVARCVQKKCVLEQKKTENETGKVSVSMRDSFKPGELVDFSVVNSNLQVKTFLCGQVGVSSGWEVYRKDKSGLWRKVRTNCMQFGCIRKCGPDDKITASLCIDPGPPYCGKFEALNGSWNQKTCILETEKCGNESIETLRTYSAEPGEYKIKVRYCVGEEMSQNDSFCRGTVKEVEKKFTIAGGAANSPVKKTVDEEDSDVCSTNSDCVPKTCCHPRECTLRKNAPDCSKVFCTMECVLGSMDCGGGECVCMGGGCVVKWNLPQGDFV